MPPPGKLASLAEISGFYGLIFTVIWAGQKLPWRPPLLAAGAFLLGACHLSNRRHGDSAEKIGLAPEKFKPAALSTLKILGGPLLILALWAAAHPVPPAPKILFGLLGYPIWAFCQQYALQSFLANRLKDLLGDKLLIICFVNGLLFALVHFPNPVLMSFCFAGGAAFTAIFLKTPHLVPISLAHAMSGFLISWIFQSHRAAMMIGPAYLRWAGLPAPLP